MSQFFSHHDLQLLNPAFDSPLVDVLTDLEYLRRLQMQGTTPYPVFMQLKRVFHLLESLGSARIEGNHTTLADYIEAQVSTPTEQSDSMLEIANIENAMQFVEEVTNPGEALTEHRIRELHSMVVNDLEREGDSTPGTYRLKQVRIARASHLPPEALHVPGYMQELVQFVNQGDPPKYDLIKIALAHHRFAWIHPFNNGNGRVVRLLTYALFIKYGFRVSAAGRLLNPAAVFCADRESYYSELASADVGTADALEGWCIYVLTGVYAELKKVDRLADYDYLKTKVLLPALSYARRRQLITPQEEAVLNATVKAGIVKAGELSGAMPELNEVQRTYQIKKLVKSGMLRPINPGMRQYSIAFTHNTLIRGIINSLTDEGFISEALISPIQGRQR